MARVKRFEDLVAWQKARVLTREIYAVSGSGAFARDYGLRDQIRRASVSVMSNVAEGFDRAGHAEFNRFLVIAKGSCAEVRSQLYVALDAQLISTGKFEQLKLLADETISVITGLRSAISKNSALC